MTDEQAQQIQNAIVASFSVFAIIAVVSIIFSIIIYWRIFSKAGYSGAMSLWTLVPIANLVVILILAFGEWPVLRELNMLRQQVGAQRQGQYPPYNQPQGQNYPSGPNYPRQ